MGARVVRGNALCALGRHADALAEFDRAAALDRREALPHLGRFNALRALGREAEASEAHKMAASLDGRVRACPE